MMWEWISVESVWDFALLIAGIVVAGIIYFVATYKVIRGYGKIKDDR